MSETAPVELDGAELVGADLRGRTLIYRGGMWPNLAGANLTGCTWRLEGPAGQTMLFLAYIERGAPNVTKQLLEGAREDLKVRLKSLVRN